MLDPGLPDFLRTQTSITTTGKPRAFLSWILLDEQFKFVQASSGSDPVPSEDYFNNGTSTPRVYVHQFSGIPITKNGYLYVYVSNETPNIDVYFDNLQVTHIRGPLLEETHYYPFGLTMSGISSKAATFGQPENKHKFNGIEQNTDFDMNMYDAQYRNYDPQIGRFWQEDPKPNDSISLYAFAFNNPIRYNDPLGDTAIVGLNTGAALGAGHMVLIFQDKNQNWFAYSNGQSDQSTAGGQRVVSGSNDAGNVFLQQLTPENNPGLKEGQLSVADVTAYLKDNKVAGYKLSETATLNTTGKQDERIAANAAQSKADYASDKKQYNLYSNNSTDAIVNVLNTNTGLEIKGNVLIPRKDWAAIKGSITIANMTPQQRAEYNKKQVEVQKQNQQFVQQATIGKF